MSEGANTLGPKGLAFLESRGIDPEHATVKLGIHTGRFSGGRVVPSGTVSADILIFPVLDKGGVRLYDKYRKLSEKKFWRESGTEGVPAVFYGAEVLADPALYREQNPLPLVITEGYEDRIVAMEAGFPTSVSVPDGAPSPATGEKPADPAKDGEDKKFEFMWTARADLARIRQFILAVDNDAPGKYLREEIVRRIGAARCSFVEYPDGCKDLSDVLRDHGAQGVTRCLNSAKPYPIRALYKLSDYPDKPKLETFTSGWASLDKHFQIYPGAFVVITGIPSHGKSTFNANWLINLSEIHGWNHAIITPENPVVPQFRDKLRRQVLRSPLYRGGAAAVEPHHIAHADAFIERHLAFIEPDPNADEDDELTVEWLLEKAHEALLRYGIKTLTIDPWNEMEHALERGETEERYANRMLRKIRRWGVQHGVAIFILAHPTKEVGKEGKARPPTPYDISGSAHWYNKPDAIVIVHRPDKSHDFSDIRIPKVRHDETGSAGQISFAFDRGSQRYSEMTAGAQDVLV